MNVKPPKQPISRRQFLRRSAQSTGLMAVAFASVQPGAYADAGPRPVDAKLLLYEQVTRFKCPRPEPKRIAVDAQGRLYVAAGKYLSQVTAQGDAAFEIALSAPARGAAIAPDGLIYISLRDHVEVFDPQGQRRAVWEIPAPRTWITGLAVTGEDVFAADAGNRSVLRYDRSGKLVGRIGPKDTVKGIPGFVVPSPFFDLKIGTDQLLRVANPGRHQVETYTLDGNLEFAWGRPTSALEGFCGCCNPINLALLGDGRVVTCEKGLPRVKVYTAPGALEAVVAGPDDFPENRKAAARDKADHTAGGLDVAADAEGRIYILDRAAAEVRIMARKSPAQARS